MGARQIDWHALKPLDRHALILFAAGIGYFWSGVIRLVTNYSDAQKEALYFADSLIPLNFWGIGFMVVGALAFLSARWPVWPKDYGYTVLTGWSAAWAAFYIIGFLGTPAEATTLSSGLIWALIAFLWWGISGLVSPEEVGETRYGPH